MKTNMGRMITTQRRSSGLTGIATGALAGLVGLMVACSGGLEAPDPCVPDPCTIRPGTVCQAGHCVVGKMILESQSPVALSGRYQWLQDTGEVAFEVASSALGTAEARFTLGGEILVATLSGPSAGSLTWGGVTFDGLGALTTEEDTALRALGSSSLVSTLALIPLEVGCRAEIASPELMAALLLPWQIGLKHFTPGLAVDPASAASAVPCRYFASEAGTDFGNRSAAGRSTFLLSDEAAFPVVLGFFPVDLPGAGSQGSGPLPLATRFGALLAESPLGPLRRACRGACGPDCPRGASAQDGSTNCAITEEWQCLVDGSGKNTGEAQLWEHFECGTAEGCRQHDSCYDQCNQTHGCGFSFAAAACRHAMGSGNRLEQAQCATWPPTPLDGAGPDSMSCDTTACQCAELEYGRKTPPHCHDWALGGGPTDGKLSFTYMRGGPRVDLERCPTDAADDTVEGDSGDGDTESDTGTTWPVLAALAQTRCVALTVYGYHVFVGEKDGQERDDYYLMVNSCQVGDSTDPSSWPVLYWSGSSFSVSGTGTSDLGDELTVNVSGSVVADDGGSLATATGSVESTDGSYLTRFTVNNLDFGGNLNPELGISFAVDGPAICPAHLSDVTARFFSFTQTYAYDRTEWDSPESSWPWIKVTFGVR